MRAASDREIGQQASCLLRLGQTHGLAAPLNGERAQHPNLKRGDAHPREPACDRVMRQTSIEATWPALSWYSLMVDFVVLEREFSEPLSPEDVREMAAGIQCLELYRVKPVRSYLTSDGMRMVCVFQAPDAEALRSLGRANGFPPGSSVWASTLHTL